VATSKKNPGGIIFVKPKEKRGKKIKGIWAWRSNLAIENGRRQD